MVWNFQFLPRWRHRRALRLALSQLPARERAVYMLTARDGLSYAEVSDRLGIQVGEVEADLARALVALARVQETHHGI